MTTILKPRETAKALERIGFNVGSSATRCRIAARNFKIAYQYEDLSSERGIFTTAVGPRMSREIMASVDRLDDPLGTMSRHFNFSEAACNCGGRYKDCIGIWATRGSVKGLEKLRAAAYPGGLSPLSWCRCAGWNRHVGGVASSRHLKGDGIDVPHTVKAQKIQSLKIYGGIGIARSDGCASHVDLRPGSPARPAMWWYKF